MSLPRYPKYKDSGYEWIGSVPEHWDIGKLKRLVSIQYGIGEPPEYRDDGPPLIRATDIRTGKIRTEGILFVGSGRRRAQRMPILQEERHFGVLTELMTQQAEAPRGPCGPPLGPLRESLYLRLG